MEKALTGGKAVSVKNVAANDPGGKKASMQSIVVGKKGASVENTTVNNTAVEAPGGKKVPRGKKAPMQSAVVGEKDTSVENTAAEAQGGRRLPAEIRLPCRALLSVKRVRP